MTGLANLDQWDEIPIGLQRLIDRFPRIFRGQPPLANSWVGPGWDDLLLDLFERIDATLSDEGATAITVVQVKEKFGGLVCYLQFGDGDDDALSDRVMRERGQVFDLMLAAERRSWETCEVCGAIGRQRERDGWLTTLCDLHAHYVV